LTTQKKNTALHQVLFYSAASFFSLILALTASAQDPVSKVIFEDSTAKLFISAVQITGNKKTKKYIIEREMQIRAGDSVSASMINKKLQQSQALIYNTTLFTEVTLVPVYNSPTDISIIVQVKEKWYLYPSPQFQLVDRNFNEWLKTSKADPKRVIYGLKFAHYNLSGRRDQLRVYALNGYTRNLSFVYTAPYSNATLTEGFSAAAGYTQNRELIYKTSSQNLPLRYSSQNFIRTSFFASGSYLMRKGFYKKHVFGFAFTNIQIKDSVLQKFNPEYFFTGKSSVSYPEAFYNYQYANTNNINYPLSGRVNSLLVLKRGLGITGGMNMLSLDADYNRYLPHTHNWYSSIQSHVKLKVPFNQSFINQRALGYGEYYLRGLENYVVDGVASFLATYTLRKKICSFKVPFPIKNKIVPFVPFAIFAKTYADAGYVFQNASLPTQLGNRMLYSGGIGLDILTLYDLNFRVEYSFNQLGEKGLFLHAKGGF
jgi:outer membrane protein assembly factor BamA